MFRTAFILSLFVSTLSTFSIAQTPEEWEARYKASEADGSRACDDHAAFEDTRRKADQGDALAAFWVFRAMKLQRCVRYNSNPFNWNSYLERSAQAGFPRALYVSGRYNVDGHAPKPDVKKGERYLIEAAEKGNASAAGYLAQAYLNGNKLRRHANNGFKYLEMGIKSGLSQKEIDKVLAVAPSNQKDRARQVIAEAKSAPAKTGEKPDTPAPTDRKRADDAPSGDPAPKFAALVVSGADSTYAWSFDHDSRRAAEQRALKECGARAGDGCDVKLVLKGPACIAYHNVPGENVYGWGMSTDRGTAMSLAQKECAKRNLGETCKANVWSCNTRYPAPIEVLVEKQMSPAKAADTADSGKGCHIMLSYTCNNFDNVSHNGKTAPYINVDAFPEERIDFPGCGTTDATRSLKWDWKAGSWTKYHQGADIPADVKERAKARLAAFTQKVKSAYPACRPWKGKDQTFIYFYDKDERFEEGRSRAPATYDRRLN
jgi:hypothetical protein